MDSFCKLLIAIYKYRRWGYVFFMLKYTLLLFLIGYQWIYFCYDFLYSIVILDLQSWPLLNRPILCQFFLYLMNYRYPIIPKFNSIIVFCFCKSMVEFCFWAVAGACSGAKTHSFSLFYSDFLCKSFFCLPLQRKSSRLSVAIAVRSIRLSVRTQDFHSWKRSSTLLWTTTKRPRAWRNSPVRVVEVQEGGRYGWIAKPGAGPVPIRRRLRP